MDEKILSRLKLNKQNVAAILIACKATPQTPPNKIFEHSFFSKENSARTAPTIKLDNIKTHNNIWLVQYLFGQLKVVHEQADVFTMGQGIFDYTGNKWTDDNNALFALYYLGTACMTIPYFVDGEKYAEVRNMKWRYKHLVPTYSPDDPRFNLEDARQALKDLGVELP